MKSAQLPSNTNTLLNSVSDTHLLLKQLHINLDKLLSGYDTTAL